MSSDAECPDNVEDLQLGATGDDWTQSCLSELRIRRLQDRVLPDAPLFLRNSAGFAGPDISTKRRVVPNVVPSAFQSALSLQAGKAGSVQHFRAAWSSLEAWHWLASTAGRASARLPSACRLCVVVVSSAACGTCSQMRTPLFAARPVPHTPYPGMGLMRL